MVVGAFPIAKLSILLIKQISKPIANLAKERAKSSPVFRTYLCMPPAQFYNWCEVKSKMWILNLGRPVNIPVLSQEMAIELGANLLGEGVIFVIGAALLIFEYNRQSKKETLKEEQKVKEWQRVTDTITELFFTVQHQETQLRELERLVNVLLSPPVIPHHDDPQGEHPPAGSHHSGGTPYTHPHPIPHPPHHHPPQPPKLPDAKDINHIHTNKNTSMLYPNNGIILTTLNYLQMDFLTSSIISNKGTIPEMKSNQRDYETKSRDKAVLAEALEDIEIDFRSLF